jgi:hypothetical protein
LLQVAVDEDTGDVYVATGNGASQDMNGPTGKPVYGNAVLKLSSRLELLDFFVPFDTAEMNIAGGLQKLYMYCSYVVTRQAGAACTD